MKTVKLLWIAILMFTFPAQGFSNAPNIILFGLPGAGKGTLSQKLIEAYPEYVHICPGNLLREEVRKQSAFGKAIEPVLVKGDYLPEQTTFGFLKSRIVKAGNENLPVIFDGYPRSLEAVRLLDSLLEGLGMKKNTIVVHLKSNPQELLDRVLNRVVCNTCNRVYNNRQAYCSECQTKLEKRPQDTAEVLRKRVDRHIKTLRALLGSFREHGYAVWEIEGQGNPEKIFRKRFFSTRAS
jgi:adenylate kinase